MGLLGYSAVSYTHLDVYKRQHYMKGKKIIIWTIVILLLAGAGGGYYAWKEYNRKQKDTADLKADFTAPATALLLSLIHI